MLMKRKFTCWQLVHKKRKFVIVSQTGSISSHIHNHIGLYLYNMNYYAILKRHLQVFHKLQTEYFQIAIKTLSVIGFCLVEIETYFTMGFFLCKEIEMLSKVK